MGQQHNTNKDYAPPRKKKKRHLSHETTLASNSKEISRRQSASCTDLTKASSSAELDKSGDTNNYEGCVKDAIIIIPSNAEEEEEAFHDPLTTQEKQIAQIHAETRAIRASTLRILRNLDKGSSSLEIATIQDQQIEQLRSETRELHRQTKLIRAETRTIERAKREHGRAREDLHQMQLEAEIR